MKTVFAFRHAPHTKNVLSDADELLCVNIGDELKKRGIVFDRAFSSPQPRALSTILNVMLGMGNMLPVMTDPAIGDSKLGEFPFAPDELDALKAAAAEASMDVETFMLEYDPIREKQTNRGEEGAGCIQLLVNDMSPGMTAAFASHGGSRIEITIRALAKGTDCENAANKLLLKPASVVQLSFNDEDALVGITDLGILA